MGHLNHGYCATPQAAQGKSVNTVLAALSASSLASSNLEQLYVVLSRGKDKAEVFTDSRRSFIDAAARINKDMMATELLGTGNKERGQIQNRQHDRQQRMREHAREVQRLRQHEQQRQRLIRERQQVSRQQARSRNRQQTRRGPERDGPVRER